MITEKERKKPCGRCAMFNKLLEVELDFWKSFLEREDIAEQVRELNLDIQQILDDKQRAMARCDILDSLQRRLHWFDNDQPSAIKVAATTEPDQVYVCTIHKKPNCEICTPPEEFVMPVTEGSGWPNMKEQADRAKDAEKPPPYGFEVLARLGRVEKKVDDLEHFDPVRVMALEEWQKRVAATFSLKYVFDNDRERDR